MKQTICAVLILYNNCRMEGSNFVNDPDELERGLFSRYTTRGCAQTELNINFIPDFLRFLKGQMNPDELLRLEDYHLQNYLMQLSVNYKETRTLPAITQRVLTHIRTSNNFWYKHNNKAQLDEEQQLKRHAINRYHRDIAHLTTAFKAQEYAFSFTPTYPRKTPLNHQFTLLHGHSEPYFGTRQPLNHISLIPTFVLKKVQETTGATEQDQPVKKVKNSSPDDCQSVSLLEECIIFVLSNKPLTSNKKKVAEKEKESQNQEQSSSSSIDKQEEVQAEPEKRVIDQFQNYLKGYSSLPQIPKSQHMRTLTYNLIAICQQILLTDREKPPSSKREENPASKITEAIKRINLNGEVTNILSVLSDSQLEESQANTLSRYFLDLWDNSLQEISKQLKQKQAQSSKMGKGWLNSPEEIAKIKDQYLLLLDQPEFIQLTKYRASATGVPWKEQDYLKFLKALNQFLNIPTNNKKIATAMGDSFEPNHVKHVKAAYLISIKERLERGECGGGKRGKCLSKSEFIDRDISNFSMRWFEKAKKINKKKPKRKRRNSSDEQAEDQLDSEY